MSNSIRVRTTPGGGDKFLKVNLEQDFDFLEILSLKLTQEDMYRQFYSDYGMVVGRVFCNNGLGLPNAKVSIFVPIDPNEREEIKNLYPYRSVIDKNWEGVRYNLLPDYNIDNCHVPVGTFPSKREILDNDINLEVFTKYYKYSTTTNQAGDFMVFGVPVGNHTLNVDVDLSDIGIFSQKPYDMTEQGNPQNLFKSPTQFKSGKNLNNLTQIKNQKLGVNVLPFWGEKQKNEVGITRVDVDLNYEIKPKAIFIGSMFSDTDKNSVNKNCQTKKKTGKICETVPNTGKVNMIRKRLDGVIETFSVNGGDIIDDDGTWAYQIPMNLDFMVTDEFGKLIPAEEPNKGIATRTSVRFKIESEVSGDEGRLRTRASYLVPHNPQNKKEIDYEFGEESKDHSFRDLYWNKIYTIKNFIPRFQSNQSENSRRFVGLKDVDNCEGNKIAVPFNRLDKDFNPLYIILCVLLTLFIDILYLLNKVVSVMINLKIVKFRICDEIRMSCVRTKCLEKYYAPGCAGTCYNNTNRPHGDVEWSDSTEEAKDCVQISLADALNVYEFDFYNDWLNGSLYNVLLKYKHKRNGDKFCNADKGSRTFLGDTMVGDIFGNESFSKISEGIVKKYKGDLYYAPTTKDGKYKILATDIVCLGIIKSYDWQGLPSMTGYLNASSYLVPPMTLANAEERDEVTPMIDFGRDGNGRSIPGLLFDLNCLSVSVNQDQARSIKRICEIGVGLDENRIDEPGGKGLDRKIDNDDIEDQFFRDSFILLNDTTVNSLPETGLKSGFNGSDYERFRGFSFGSLQQPTNSFYFYFGTQPNKTAIEKMNKKYFQACILDKNIEYGEE